MPRTRLRVASLALAAALALLAACGTDPVEAIRRSRPAAVAPRTLAEALEGYRYFSRVGWSATPDRQGRQIVRATGVYDLDRLLGAEAGGRVFGPADRAALHKVGANLCFVLEDALDPRQGQAERVFTAMMIVTMDGSQPAPLADDAVLREIAQGLAGAATLKAAQDAAAYALARNAVQPGR